MSEPIGTHPGIGKGSRFLVLAADCLGEAHGKLANGVIRFRPQAVAAVLDPSQAGKTTNDLGFTAPLPIVGSLAEGLRHRPNALLIGAATPGGYLPPSFRTWVLEAIDAGLSVVSGLHAQLTDDVEFTEAAAAAGVELVDLRRPPDEARLRLATGEVLDLPDTKRIVLTVGDDAAVGKMTTALVLDDAARATGLSTNFVATGQTGIAIAGWGVAIDRVIGDFMPGVSEQLVLRAAENADVIFVEGQGSIAHPAFSPVTLGLLHGAAPTELVLCHDPARSTLIDYDRAERPSLTRLILSYEDLCTYVRPARVAAIAVNSSSLIERDARALIARVEAETGLPADDVVRFGGDQLAAALLGTAWRAEIA